jgi:PAS domain S-box-containing protein
MQDKSGVDVTVVSSLRDVDDLVQTREAAEADRAVLRATVDSLLDPQVQLDPVRDEARQIVDFVYVDANPAACAYNGMAYQDLVGARLLDLFPGHAGAGLLDQYRHVLETSEPLVLDDFVYAQELMGGTERRYDIRAARVNGGLTYTWRDVTDRYMAAQTLAESEEQYRFLAENASDVVMRLSPDRRHELVSGSVADVLGWQAPDLVGHLIDEFIHPDDLPSFRQVVADAAPGCAARVEFRFRRSDGTYRWVACRTRTKVDEDGTPVSMVGGLVDISDRKAAEAEERKRLQELECFQRLTVGRELKMIELKKEIEYLKKHISAKGSDPRDQFET